MAWINMDIHEFNRKLDGLPPAERDLLNGMSPGGTAAYLGISRAAVHSAINRGRMTGYRLTLNGKMVAIIIPRRSMVEYENSESRHENTPKLYRQA